MSPFFSSLVDGRNIGQAGAVLVLSVGPAVAGYCLAQLAEVALGVQPPTLSSFLYLAGFFMAALSFWSLIWGRGD